MILESFAALKKHLSTNQDKLKRVVVANPTDSQTLSAVMSLYDEKILFPILVGEKIKILEGLDELSITETSTLEIVDVSGETEIAEKSVSLIRQGMGDVLMKGHIQTRDLLKAVVNKEKGIRKQSVLSHVSINEIPYYHKLLFLTDGGMVLTPDIDTKQAILMNVLDLTKQLGYEKTKVAVLDASENVNPKLQASLDAEELKKRSEIGMFGEAIVEGPISLDLSLSTEIAKEKEYESPVAGEADVLLVSDIVSGNLLGKSMMTFGNGKMAGLVLGATVPIIITSRGSTAEEKINSLMIACAM
ncbi:MULTISPECIES: phosphate acyltransferase [Vagococcus]|uniref:Phosphotransbutyrylase n=1 Tax=Vagococcus fluvialis bH819 TaxID=1255619 RepID=A0A1X6WN44_9ENTE|nr:MULTISPECIES: phosphate acyltransferase [Vagococcus]SLM85700.1 phosphotransbutyrylase [Vagococcus fluvialis bH819]HCM90122.1 phosphate butyryltransferase [Vagococcus sp.]